MQDRSLVGRYFRADQPDGRQSQRVGPEWGSGRPDAHGPVPSEPRRPDGRLPHSLGRLIGRETPDQPDPVETFQSSDRIDIPIGFRENNPPFQRSGQTALAGQTEFGPDRSPIVCDRFYDHIQR